MGDWLPFEVLLHIAECLEEDRDSLVQCARVCMQWKAVFERLLYRRLHVLSNDLVASVGDLSLTRFEALTSAAGTARRTYIKHLIYHIVLPYDVGAWPDDTPDGETSSFRNANDTVFAVAIINLFTALSSWENTRFKLTFQLVGCLDSYELGMEETSVDGQEEEPTAPPYQARLPSTELFKLPEIQSIDKFFVSDYLLGSVGIGSGTAIEIAHCFPKLQSLELSLITHDDPEFQINSRKALIQGIKRLPPTLKTFRYSELYSEFMEREIQAVDLLLGENDLLWPLDQTGEPASSTTDVCWPHLETIELCPAQYLPTGEPLFEIADFRTTIRHEIFHRFCIAMGYAARHMPRLSSIVYCAVFEEAYFTRFNFLKYLSKRTGIRKGMLRFVSTWHPEGSPALYIPDERVKNAWGWSENTEVFEISALNREIMWKFSGWPPASW
ncbi:F-box protein [Aspergillus foveolatus]|uniref:F-box protein n=1 Tax=Aspergillus foveolatus TaxID=210207 RepID=UPI003CCD4869